MFKTANIAGTNATDAQFRAWIDFIISGLVDFGWVRTADTGQFDVSSIARPTVANTAMGYQIFRMADTLQATAPVFLKLEFGSGTNANAPAIWYTIGTGSDGSGGITGVALPRSAISASNPGPVLACYLSADASRVQVAMFASGSAGYNFCISIERTHSGSGIDNGLGLQVLGLASSGATSAYVPFAGVAPASQTEWNVCSPPVGTGALSPDIYCYPVRCWSPGETYPCFGVVVYKVGDFAMGGTYAVRGYDAVNRTYIMLGTGARNVGYGGTNYIGVRYE